MLFKELSWDSEFFGFDVGRLYGDPNKDNLTEMYKEMAAKNIRLAYYFADKKIAFAQHPFYKAQLADVKVTYTKDLIGVVCDEHVHPYGKDYPEKKLISLAIESGVYSRFKKDKAIPVLKYEELYEKWIVNSVKKEIADEVLVYETNGHIAGLVTVGVKNARGDIGIIAVDKEYRRKGVASALMNCAENFIADKYKSIQVVTQKDNLSACSLYERCNYQLEKTEYVYHIWRK